MKSYAHSAVTVINAMANGKGGAIGIDLGVFADVDIVEEGLSGEILVRGEEYTDFSLINNIKTLIEERLDVDFGMDFMIHSEIPIGKGLKSSSAVSNAVTKATVKALDFEIEDIDIIKIGIEASKRAGVTLTGAFDDAYASYFGGFCLTDNLNNEVLKSEDIDRYKIVILIPDETVLTSSLKDVSFKDIRPYIDLIFESALNGRWKEAIYLNGLVYSSFFGYDVSVMMDVLEFSKTVGLSGKGPAVYSITDHPSDVIEKWKPHGEILEVHTT
ncbi:MAG: shikimate kinase [Thermoplasmatota archaeon]